MTIAHWNSLKRSYHRILHPTDLTELDAYPFQVARALARGLNAELIVMHAAPLSDLNEVPGYRARIEHQLKLMRLFEPGLTVTTHLFSGDPASQIVGWAEEALCDAIVMRSSRTSWFLGRLVDNVSQRVKKLVRCPVIEIAGRPLNGIINEEWKLFRRRGRPGPARVADQSALVVRRDPAALTQ